MDARSAYGIPGIAERDRSVRLGLIGHSEGGMIAFMLASEYEDISFIVSLAGPGVDGKTILLDQSEYINRLSGVGKSVVGDNRLSWLRYMIMKINESHASWGEEVIEFTSSYYSNNSKANIAKRKLSRSKGIY